MLKGGIERVGVNSPESNRSMTMEEPHYEDCLLHGIEQLEIISPKDEKNSASNIERR